MGGVLKRKIILYTYIRYPRDNLAGDLKTRKRTATKCQIAIICNDFLLKLDKFLEPYFVAKSMQDL